MDDELGRMPDARTLVVEEDKEWRDPTALAPMLSEERRRRAEATLADGLNEHQRMLLPLALALARLAARRCAAARRDKAAESLGAQ